MTASPPPMALALAEAEAAAARGEVPVGAVLIDGAGQVVAAAGNRVEADRDPTAHAEMVVLRAGAKLLGVEASRRVRSVGHARTLRDVRGGDRSRASAPALLRRLRPEGRRGRARPAPVLASRPSITARRSMAGSTSGGPRNCCALFSKAGASSSDEIDGRSGEAEPRQTWREACSHATNAIRTG